MDGGRLAGQVALVTGASRGIGRGVAERLASEGARVVLTARSADLLKEAAAAIRDSGGDALAVPADLTREEDVDRLFGRFVDRYGPPDILVNNASRVYDTSAHFLDITLELWDGIMASNLRSLYLCSVRAARLMAERRSGSIVNISGAAAARAHRNNAPYDATKGAAETLTRAMAIDLAPFGIRVNCVGPGPILVEGWGEVPPDEMKKRIETVPLGRLGSPADIAGAVVFFCSADASFVTGQVLYVDGGLLAQLRPPQVDLVEPPDIGARPGSA